MARIDDYINAKTLAVEALAHEDFGRMSMVSGFDRGDDGSFQIPFLGREYRLTCPQFEFTDHIDPGKEVPIQEQVLILHYLRGAGNVNRPVKNWISYREIPGAAFYFSAFVKRATEPLKMVFGNDPDALRGVAAKLGGVPIEMGDVGFEIVPLPKTPLQYILWEGDDEFPSEANVLFDETVGDILSPEDAAWLAGVVVYRMMALAKQG